VPASRRPPSDEEDVMGRFPRTLSWLLFALAPLLTAAAGAPRDGSGYTLTEGEKKFLELTNAERARHKLPPLKLNLTLSKVARAHSANMAKQNKMVHVLDGKDQFARIKGSGYRYRYAGENVARGNIEITEMVEALMKSEGHRKNILKKEYTELGVGLALGGKDLTYYTQVFASPKRPAKAP
jgi:uncharacterized protein YkwD